MILVLSNAKTVNNRYLKCQRNRRLTKQLLHFIRIVWYIPQTRSLEEKSIVRERSQKRSHPRHSEVTISVGSDVHTNNIHINCSCCSLVTAFSRYLARTRAQHLPLPVKNTDLLLATPVKMAPKKHSGFMMFVNEWRNRNAEGRRMTLAQAVSHCGTIWEVSFGRCCGSTL